MKNRQKILGVLIGCSLIFGSPESMAAEQEFTFDDYVVTANRIPLKQAETAASVTVITRNEIEKGVYTHVLEILEKVSMTQ